MLPTPEELRALFAYDPETGEVTSRIKRGRTPAGSRVGGLESSGYLQVSIGGRLFMLHRVIWAIVHGRWPDREIDHKNRIRNDNRLDNLREATPSQNTANRVTKNRLGIRGVREANGHYEARISKNYRLIRLGLFDTPELAKEFYDLAAEMLYGNFIQK